MSDGFALMPLPRVADDADATRSKHIGIIISRAASYPSRSISRSSQVVS